DTPGQMEVFIFRDVAPKIFEAIKRVSKNVLALFVLDGEVIKRFEDYAFISIMSVALQARLGVDVIPAINKCDIAPNLELMGDVVSDVDLVTERLRKSGLYGEMLAKIMDILWLYAKATRVPKVSAKNMQGLEELHRIVHEFTCSCGDLT
ncbi:MAG: ATP/GTP-binding protein, partial [Ignisphaera sp.]